MKVFDRETCNVPMTQRSFIDMFVREMFKDWAGTTYVARRLHFIKSLNPVGMMFHLRVGLNGSVPVVVRWYGPTGGISFCHRLAERRPHRTLISGGIRHMAHVNKGDPAEVP